MKYILLFIPFFLFADNFNFIKKEEKKEFSLLNEIKEKNGLILSKEEIIEKELKLELNKVLTYYEKKRANVKDIKEYLETTSISDLFKTDKMFSFNGKEIKLNEIVYHLAIKSENGLFELYLEKEGYKPLNFNFDSMKKELAVKRIKDLYSTVISKGVEIEKGSTLLDLYVLEKYDLLRELLNYSYYKKDFKLTKESFLFFVANEEKFKKETYLFDLIKEKLYSEIEKNETVEFKEVLIEEKPSKFIKNYNMVGYLKNEVYVSAPFISYLLKAKGKSKFNINPALALEEAYGMKEFEVLKVDEFIITFTNGKFYREYDKKGFEYLEKKGK